MASAQYATLCGASRAKAYQPRRRPHGPSRMAYALLPNAMEATILEQQIWGCVINRVEGDLDIRMRSAAFEHVRRLNATHDYLSSQQLAEGFLFEGSRVPLVNQRRGIFKPRQMRQLLSIRTIFPKPGTKVWYDDQRQVHRKIYQSDDLVEYAFMGNNPDVPATAGCGKPANKKSPLFISSASRRGVSLDRFQPSLPNGTATS